MRRMTALILAILLQCAFAARAEFFRDASGLLHRLLDAQEKSSIDLDGVRYRTGFYDEGCGFRDGIQGEAVFIDGQEYCRVVNDQFDLLLRSGGKSNGVLTGTLYCAENQLDAARAYYADGANYDYYCRIGAQYVDREPEIRALTDADPAMFDRLMEFAAKNAYDPFGENRADGLLHLPIPDRDASPELCFYRESRDGCLISHRGYTFHIVDGALLLLYYYDYGHGESGEMVASALPDDLSAYFTALLNAD